MYDGQSYDPDDEEDRCLKTTNCSMVKTLNDDETKDGYGLSMAAIGEGEANVVLDYCMQSVKKKSSAKFLTTVLEF